MVALLFASCIDSLHILVRANDVFQILKETLVMWRLCLGFHQGDLFHLTLQCSNNMYMNLTSSIKIGTDRIGST